MKQVGLDLWCRMQRKEFGKCIHCGIVNHVIIGSAWKMLLRF